MPFDFSRARPLLQSGDLATLFVEELGWEPVQQRLILRVGEGDFRLSGLAEKSGFTAWLCESSEDRLPDHATRLKLDRALTQTSFEHLIVFATSDYSRQSWMWVRRQPGKPLSARTHEYSRGLPGDSLLQKLQLLFVSLEEEEAGLSVTQVTGRVKAAFDVERVTKKFYKEFDSQRRDFLKFIGGIGEVADREWYASVMLNRLMFIYFIQRKGFLDGDPHYLRNRLKRTQAEYGRGRFYSFYRYFLLRLFHEGLGGRKRAADLEKLLGRIPYLNGGMFDVHELEKPERYGNQIQIPDQAFEAVFDYFDQYQWHLDERPLRADNEINPDVLGYIFEKYINQKQMGAYYTKEDITEYISKNTVIPFLFDAARKECKVAFENPAGPTVWDLLREDPDRYIYSAVRHGADQPLPPEIAEGLDTSQPNLLERRRGWNRPAPEEHALPTEIWREVVARRLRYEEVKQKLAEGHVRDINDLITLNLDIRQFAQDVIENCEGPELLRASWHAIEKVTILDPTCGSGAFLFAALNILEPLYEACLDRMEAFLADLERSGQKHRPEKFSDFRKLLERVAGHPNRRYFIFKSIILNNLFGVDIMEEAVEICQLRLFLKLAAQVEPDPAKDNLGIEPLPDIDFNIRAGNTLVGYATLDEIKKSMDGDWIKQLELPRIQEQAEIAGRAFQQFHKMQTEQGMDGKEFVEAKITLRKQLKALEDQFNHYLAIEYGVEIEKKFVYSSWVKSHQPFHWFVEFFGIMQKGGFDIIIGNPPYIEYRKVIKQYTLPPDFEEYSTNLYSACSYRGHRLKKLSGYMSFIVPVSLPSTDRMQALREIISKGHKIHHVSFSTRPSKLFEGAEQRLTIYVQSPAQNPTVYSGGYLKWGQEERPYLFDLVQYVNLAPLINKKSLWPKVKGEFERSIFEKMLRHKNVGDAGVPDIGARLYYKNTGIRNFNTVTLRPPKCWINGKPTSSSRETILALNPERLHPMHCFLISSTFFFYYQATSNCRDLNPSDISFAPEPDWSSSTKKLEELSKAIEKDYTAKAKILKMHNKLTGLVELESLTPSVSKPIIDEIDRILALHYGFTEEELDFIINYDIKYRMGRDAAGDAEG